MKRYLNILASLLIIAACTNKHPTKLSTAQNNLSKNCDCTKDTLLAQIISCEPISLDNGAKLYWNYNCDSSWIPLRIEIERKKQSLH